MKDYKKRTLIRSLMGMLMISTFSLATTYEDAEDRSTQRWKIYDNKPSGATIRNVKDAQQNSKVIEFKGKGAFNAYMIGSKKGKHGWNNKEERILSWKMKFSESYKISVYLDTQKGRRVFYYTYKEYKEPFTKGKYIRLSLGKESKSGKWVNIHRDLAADLKKYDPTNKIITINGFKVQGSGFIDDLMLTGRDTQKTMLNTHKKSGNTKTTSVNSKDSKYMLTAWNDLGMHCMDGNDFSVFSVLPPYNNLHAQLKDKSGDLITSGVTLTYESVKGTDGKMNTDSTMASNGKSKTNFWQYSDELFGASLAENEGLKGNAMASRTPQELTFNATHQWWEAEGIPITPYNDDGSKNYYPLVKVVAKDSNGKVIASVNTVLPVSDEMDCKRCHSSKSGAAAKPSKGWVNNSDKEKDYKYNILRLHDESEPDAVSKLNKKLQAKGYTYNVAGLEATAKGGTPVLCVACHKSNALPGVGVEIKAFTSVIHKKHANVTDPKTGKRLGASNNRNACYACHPGSKTECLRGAMGDAKGKNAMQCQSCHGDMSHVGASNREGWFDEPNCQSCHHDGKREISAIDPRTNTLRHALDSRFATKPNTPTAGKSLYRFSKGHGDLQCEACHGATHAIYPAHEADNKVSISIQGHTGTLSECKACHTKVPKTVTGGPHGMHPVGASWVDKHQDVAENDATQCKVCHGKDYKGSVLSKMFMDRVLETKDNGNKNFKKGHQVNCYDCHNGPSGDSDHDTSKRPIKVKVPVIKAPVVKTPVKVKTPIKVTLPVKVPVVKTIKMHTTSDQYAKKDHRYAARKDRDSCKSCHGDNYKGTKLSKLSNTRKFKTRGMGSKTITKGHQISCYDCHNGPHGKRY